MQIVNIYDNLVIIIILHNYSAKPPSILRSVPASSNWPFSVNLATDMYAINL